MKAAIITVMGMCLFVATTIMSLIMVVVAVLFCIMTMLSNFNMLTVGVSHEHTQTFSNNDVLILNGINVGILALFYGFLKLIARFNSK